MQSLLKRWRHYEALFMLLSVVEVAFETVPMADVMCRHRIGRADQLFIGSHIVNKKLLASQKVELSINPPLCSLGSKR